MFKIHMNVFKDQMVHMMINLPKGHHTLRKLCLIICDYHLGTKEETNK